ncbi:MAG: alpha/beta hydrolase [Limisphaerales bacterium]
MKAVVIFPLFFACLVLSPCNTLSAEFSKTFNLWPGTAPGEKNNPTEESNLTKPSDRIVAGKSVIRMGNVSKPTLSIFRPEQEKNSGAAVLVFPGGAYNILATDIEGTEVCEWLNSLGITAALVKYRVPRREGLEKHFAPLQDAQRAMSLLRSGAAEWKIDPKKIGVMGFSAGGHLAATLCVNTQQRSYTNTDSADAVSCRPDFALLIYPAYFTPTNDLTKFSAEIKVTTNQPPTFMAMTQDDPLHVENVLLYSLALKQAKIPFELHVFPTGGHGYGLRKTGNVSSTWPERAKEWLRAQGLLSSGSSK